MNEKKRKQKQYYVNQAKRARFEKRKLHPGLRGFLCTTNNKERECVREAYNLLNEFSNQMYGAEDAHQESAAGSGATDVEQSLEAELAALKEEKVSKQRRFQQVDSGAKNCIFISTQLEQTAPLVERIAQEIRESGTQRTRYLLRLLPVQVTCKATEADIRASAETMIKEAFTELGVTYTTVFRSRNQSQLTQTDAQTAINSLIDAVCPTARLDHKTPQLTVVMEAIRNIVCLGVVRDFFEMRKYNLVELAKGAAEGGGGGEGKEEGGGENEEHGREDSKEDTGRDDPASEKGGERAVEKAEGVDSSDVMKDVSEDSAVTSSGTEGTGESGAPLVTSSGAAAAAEAATEPPPAQQSPDRASSPDQAPAATSTASSEVRDTPANSAAEPGTGTEGSAATGDTASDTVTATP